MFHAKGEYLYTYSGCQHMAGSSVLGTVPLTLLKCSQTQQQELKPSATLLEVFPLQIFQMCVCCGPEVGLFAKTHGSLSVLTS